MSDKDKEHLSLYKTKSGNHLLRTSHRERLQDEKKKIRNKERHAAYTAHRVIEKTPQKQCPTAPCATAIVPKLEPPTATVSTKNQSLLDRKIAFIERFQRYRDKKTKALNEKKKVVPFVSSVPTGRYVAIKSAQPTAAAIAPSAPKKLEPKQIVAIQQMTTTPTSRRPRNQRYSPINTRSKKFTLLSPSQLPTPTRKKKKSIAVREPTRTITKKMKNVVAPATVKSRTANSNKVLAPKVTNVASTVRKVLSAQMVPKTVPKNSTVNNRPNIETKKPATVTASKPFKITEVPEIPSKFDFTTSTAVKPRNSIVASVRSRQNSVQLFNESISPIENGTPKISTKLPGAPKEMPAATVPADLNVTPVHTEAAMNTSVNYVSPFVTISRGKHHASKEREARETKYKLASRKSIDLNESTEDRQNKEAALYFRNQIKSETDRMMALVDKWLAVKEANGDTIPCEYIDLIDVAIGQTRLLINNKFEQFRGLVDKCEAAIPLHPVRPEDLEGFWGMVYMQVENCYRRFERLDVLHANDWQDPDVKLPKVKKIKPNGAISKPKAKTTRPNSVLAKMLNEARKKMKESKENEESKISATVASTFIMNRRKSLLLHRDLNDSATRRSSTPRKSGTPRKTIWVVSIHSMAAHTSFNPFHGIHFSHLCFSFTG